MSSSSPVSLSAGQHINPAALDLLEQSEASSPGGLAGGGGGKDGQDGGSLNDSLNCDSDGLNSSANNTINIYPADPENCQELSPPIGGPAGPAAAASAAAAAGPASAATSQVILNPLHVTGVLGPDTVYDEVCDTMLDSSVHEECF